MSAQFNLYIDQGITFSSEIIITGDDGEPVDMTNAEIRSQVRKSHTSTTAYPFDIEKLDPENGKLRFVMTAAQTALMPGGRYVYDAEYQIDELVVRFVKGSVTVYPRVTQ
jgi:hypothetical protein